MTAIVTEKEILTQILMQYKKSPCLWDPTNKYYHDKKVRHESYEGMLELWQKMEPHGTVLSLKKKLEHVRTSYRREWKKVVTSLANGASPNSAHKPNLWYYNHLTFLNTLRQESSSKDSTDDDDDKHVVSPRKKKKRASEKEDTQYRTEEQRTEERPSSARNVVRSTSGDDYVTTYGQTIAQQLRELDDGVRYEAERIISDVIYRARTGTLPRYSPQAVDQLFIPPAGPSWYDMPDEQSVTQQQNNCYVVTVGSPSEQIMQTEFEVKTEKN